MVYYDDMCKSKLGKLMCAFRADRPSEWQMDEFIDGVEKMYEELNNLKQTQSRMFVNIKDIPPFPELADVGGFDNTCCSQSEELFFTHRQLQMAKINQMHLTIYASKLRELLVKSTGIGVEESEQKNS